MAGGWTNRGRKRIEQGYFQRVSLPTNLYIALVKADVTPTYATNTLGDLVEIAAGNGYTSGGYSLTPGTTDFTTLTEDDVNNLARVTIKDISWTASGGPIPASGTGARWAVLTDDNGTVGSRDVLAWFDLGSAQSRDDGLSLILTGGQLRATLPA